MTRLNLDAASDFSFSMERYAIKVRYYRLARHALANALNCMRLVSGDRVLLPSFICRDLLAPIHAAGAVPVYYEVDRELRPIELPLDGRVRAVVAVNYFGFPQNLESFHHYCDRFGAVLIEDNAHGFLSCDASGRLLGERGDFGLFSIRKTFLLPDGAMLMANTPEWQVCMSEQLSFRRELLPLTFWMNYVLSCRKCKAGIAFYSLVQELIRTFRYLKTGHAIAPSRSTDECELPLFPAPHQVSMSILAQKDFSGEIERRRRLYVKFHELFSFQQIKPLFNTLPEGTVPYGYPFYAEESAVAQVAKIARLQGFSCIHWPALPAAVEQNAPSHYKKIWLVNFLC